MPNLTYIAPLGLSLADAALSALAYRANELCVCNSCDLPVDAVYFDYHGIQQKVTASSTQDELVAFIDKAHQSLASDYETSPSPVNATEKKHEGGAGRTLTYCAIAALQSAQKMSNPVRGEAEKLKSIRHIFVFNGVQVPFNPWAEGEAARLEDAYVVESAKRWDAYRASPEYLESQVKIQEEQKRLQEAVPELMSALPTVLAGPMDALMNWVTDFADAHDRVGVNIDVDAVVSAFIAQGYLPNVYLGPEFESIFKTDKEKFGRYILGQFLSILPMQRGMPNILWYMADKYRSMNASAKVNPELV